VITSLKRQIKIPPVKKSVYAAASTTLSLDEKRNYKQNRPTCTSVYRNLWYHI